MIRNKMITQAHEAKVEQAICNKSFNGDILKDNMNLNLMKFSE